MTPDKARTMFYVGGTYGDVPTVISTSLETALRRTVDPHLVPSADYGIGCDVVWTCRFVDGQQGLIRFEADAPDTSGKRLYVELMEEEVDYVEFLADRDP